MEEYKGWFLFVIMSLWLLVLVAKEIVLKTAGIHHCCFLTQVLLKTNPT
jgi:hypothetical protein